MNSLERITATLSGAPADRHAVAPLLALYGARLTGCAPETLYRDAAAYARGQSAVRERFQPDILFAPFALALEGAAFGSRVRFFGDQAPNLVRPAIASADEIGHLVVPDIDAHPGLLYFRECVRRMASEHGDQVPVAAITVGPVDLPAVILGMEGWLETLLFDESGTKRMFELTTPFFVRWLNALLSDGAAFAVLPTAFVKPSIVTREIVLEKALPVLEKAFAEIEGPILIHSSGAPVVPFLELFAALPNVVGFVLNGGESFSAARAKVGAAPVLVGNIEGPGLAMCEREEIEASCRAVLNDRRDDPCFILGTSMADVGFDTPPENISVFRETACDLALENPA